MAHTAVNTIDVATASYGTQRIVTCTVTNGGASDVLVTGVTPVVCPTGTLNRHTAAVAGKPILLTTAAQTVPGSGTLVIKFPVTCHAPGLKTPNLSMPTSRVYDIGATVTISDGSVVTADVVNLTVSVP
jgi:hypothetical protein